MHNKLENEVRMLQKVVRAQKALIESQEAMINALRAQVKRLEPKEHADDATFVGRVRSEPFAVKNSPDWELMPK